MSIKKSFAAFIAAIALTSASVVAPAFTGIVSVSAEAASESEEKITAASVELSETEFQESLEAESYDSVADEDAAESYEYIEAPVAEKSASVTVGKVSMKSGYTATDTSVKVSWNAVSGADGYYLYRYSAFAPVWLRIADVTSGTSYTSTKILPGNYYNFRVKAYKFVNGNRVFGSASDSLKTATKPTNSKILAMVPSEKKIQVVWNKISCSGYELYMLDNGSWRKVKTVTDYNVNSYTVTGLTAGTSYSFKIRAYTKDQDGGIVYNDYSTIRKISTTGSVPSDAIDYVESSTASRLNSAVLGSSKTSFKCYNRQGTTTTSTTVTLSSSDIATLRNFANTHFTSGMTQAQKVDYTLQWIHYNVVYADGKEGRPAYSELYDKSYVDAIFNYKMGQCLQFNGALISMMAYLGYDVNLVQGYRGFIDANNMWQHFWGEVKINGTTYLMDTGNAMTDGAGWYFCCAKYSESCPWPWNAHYIMNGKEY